MVDHGHLEDYRPWKDHHLTMVITWLMMVMVLLTDHGQPWLTMVNISDLTTIDHYMTMTIDHGRPWSWPSFHLTNMVDHDQTMVNWWSFHGRPWSMTMIDHGQTMVDHGLTIILLQGHNASLHLQGCHFPDNMKFPDFSRQKLSSFMSPRPFRRFLGHALQNNSKLGFSTCIGWNEFKTTKFPKFSNSLINSLTFLVYPLTFRCLFQIPWLFQVSDNPALTSFY